jgi:peptidoglycan/xylan/chitin deacetylase (PgdA/CDA1 family)
VLDPSPATWTWTVDGTTPDTTIASGPSGTVASASASFAFNSSEAGTFECSLDAGAWALCASPKSYSGLANGTHTFAVRAADAAGNVDGSPATRTWTVDVATSDPEPRTIVSLTFDDGQATQYPAVRDLLASRGMHGTFFINSAKVGTSDFYLTWDQVAALAADGNEIGGHTLTHADLTGTSLPEAEKRRQVCEDRQNLIARGYDPVTFAYPGGGTDILAESIVRDCGYGTGRAVGGIVSPNWCPNCGSPRAETLPPANPFATRTPSFGSGELTLAAMQNVITQAELAGGWVPLVFHGVCETATCGTGWVRPSTLAALMDWLGARSAQGTVVRTMRQALDPGNPPPPPPVAPDTSITNGPSGTVASNAASFEFSSDQAGATFECKLDAGAWEACSTPKSYSGLGSGSHTFSVRAKDGAQNVDASPATRTWTIDTAPPDTSITTGPSGTIASTTASFAFSASEEGSSFECKLDAADWEACASPKPYAGLADGAHTFSVRAKDGLGNVDSSPATRTWTVDTTAADTSITSGPSGTVRSTSASFGFTATQAGSFECKLDTGAWAACTSPKAYSGLLNGAHTFSVRVKDAAGNVDATPATRTWTVDTIAPNTTITSGPSGTITSSSATFTFTATEAGATFECRLDTGAWAACTSPKAYTGLATGSHTFRVRAKDAAGNVDGSPATRSWKRRR